MRKNWMISGAESFRESHKIIVAFGETRSPDGATGSRECAPDDGLREIRGCHRKVSAPDCAALHPGYGWRLRLVAGRREQVAAAADGADHRRLGRIDLDLAPDPHNAQIDGAVEGFG